MRYVNVADARNARAVMRCLDIRVALFSKTRVSDLRKSLIHFNLHIFHNSVRKLLLYSMRTMVTSLTTVWFIIFEILNTLSNRGRANPIDSAPANETAKIAHKLQ